MKHKPYPKYKPSGIDWIGDIPEGWALIPLKHLTQFVNGSAFKPLDWSLEGIPIVRIENLNGSDSFNYYEGNIDNRYYIYKNDLLFGWSGNRGTSFGPFLWWKDGLCYLNQHIFKLVSYQCDKKWLYWSLKAVTHYIEEEAHGIIGMVHITKGRLGAIKIPTSIHEQKQIVAFLDYKTAQIDDLIQKKEEMIRLLKEKRAAIINQAVTKGLDPYAKMKPSGIDWIGDIPEGWGIRRLKFLTKIISKGATPSTIGREILSDGNIRFLKAENIQEDEIQKYPEFFIDEETNKLLKRSELKEEDILFVIAGATIGKAGLLKKEFLPANTNQAVSFVRLVKGVNKKFILYWLQSVYIKRLTWLNAVQSAQPNLSMESLGDFAIPYPSTEEEQQQIANYLDEKTEMMDSLIQQIDSAIVKLREYRSSLITAAVTGKIDVREDISL